MVSREEVASSLFRMATPSSMQNTSAICISIISHNQIAMVRELFDDFNNICNPRNFRVILTVNAPEEHSDIETDNLFELTVLRNNAPKGFAENHNTAFIHCDCDYFCVMNPDLRLSMDPFPPMLAILVGSNIGILAPLVLNDVGAIENSYRDFPRPMEILLKALGMVKPLQPIRNQSLFSPDWVAGMFMLFPAHIFGMMGGFDSRYFLYYEDVDICTRLTLRSFPVAVTGDASVIHLAQRHSHKKIRYLLWHIASVLRYFLSEPYRQIMKQRKR